MALSQDHIFPTTPMGANLTAGGATFRVWAPRARDVYVCGDFNGWLRNDSTQLTRQPDGRWTGFVAGATDGNKYKFYIVGEGSEGFKRDPYARELTREWPNPSCIIRLAVSFPWQDWNWRMPEFSDLIIYQLHIGTWYGLGLPNRVATFLDVLARIEYLADLGINAIEPLPIGEYSTPRSMGYNGSDLFSPEMDYFVSSAELDPYLALANRLLAQKGKSPLTREILEIGINQLKVLIDICHHYNIAVIFDMVYNHASGDIRGQAESLYFFDRAAGMHPNDSLYFSDRDHTGPVFAMWNSDVRQFLIDNAAFFADEYHVDGFRYDQVTVIDQENIGSGWLFCQHLNQTIRSRDPAVINIAEYWGPEPAVVRPMEQAGADFDASWHDGQRLAIRALIKQAAAGRDAPLDWQGVVDQIRAPGFRDAWRAVQCVESHDEVYRDRSERIPLLAAGGGNTRTWYATSRSRVATGLLLTLPGIPMIFMGQEFYEDKKWADDPVNHPDTLIFWGGLDSDRTMSDFHRFTRELIGLRRRQPALRGEQIKVLMMDNFQRVLVFHRWLERLGRDTVVVVSLNEQTMSNFRVPMPGAGPWLEIFNSDAYERWINPAIAGNGGMVSATEEPMNDMSCSAAITIPANGILVFSRDYGD
ncbi:alpha amylase C-terminal domain-containing protein [Pseudomonas fluorescens]|uniref:1,4-alpha-glucan branching enzyme n=1 Tax=Pseudomonas fluorescens TaxID=294 RepID=A0A5E7FYT2_PSEFL|nr:alpha-amylase family glycosyl hydrolase [Pseudomonas fluorescens]VVO43427.1 1,4-alpha-glucan branching enzyme GlgB [Pseudomonas fluorescens]